MGFRKKLLMKLKRDQNVVLVADARSYKQMSLRMYKALSKDFGKICIITSATPVPTLVEWDAALPSLDELLAEAARADALLAAETRAHVA